MILILSANFYSEITDALEKAAKQVLDQVGKKYEIMHVPGAVELPLAIQHMIAKKNPEAVIALGCVIQGETDHYDYVLQSCTDGLTRVALDTGVPVIQGVLACRNREQAEDRKTKKGTEFAQTALAMVELLS